jgi:hypothetical protein
MALPAHVDRVVLHAHPADADGPVVAVVAVADPADGVDARVVDGSGRVWVDLEGYRTVVLPAPVDEASLAALRAVRVEG